jgi:iron complex outermembrane receptor protein
VKRLLTLALIAAGALAVPATAQEPDEPPQDSVESEGEEAVRLTDEITVSAGHSERRIRDVPLRVEVVDREEIEEKALMTPGSVAMLLAETTGLRVQLTAPATGAANVRIQGLRGRYSLLLSDGLPLHGVDGGSLSLLQVPPLDLGQVEIIKGAASALYGPSALGGVINLVSQRPGERDRRCC